MPIYLVFILSFTATFQARQKHISVFITLFFIRYGREGAEYFRVDMAHRVSMVILKEH